MLAGAASTSLPPPSKGSKWICVLLILLISAGIFSVFYFGGQEVHETNNHLLYDSFE